MANGIAGIDHVIVAVRDLDRARMRWTRLGFSLSPHGRHIGQGTANYCIMFAADYLELLGVVAPDDFAHRLESFLANREGLMAAGFALCEPAETVRAALLACGLHPAEPRQLGRQLELPEGTVVPRFSLIALPPEETPGLDCFLCRHLTPELMRRPEWLEHPNGAVGIRAVHVLVDTTAPLPAAYQRLFGLQRVTTTGAVAGIDFGRHRIVFSTPDDFLAMHPGAAVGPAFALPGIAALDLFVRGRDETADYLAQWQIAFDEMADGRLAVPACEANGALLFFTEA